MQMPGRNWRRASYRYGFQSQEQDDEIKGEGSSINYKYRMHDPRIGRFLSIDPLAPDYPWNSPYAFSENRVIASVEIEGLEARDLNGNIVFVEDPNAPVKQVSGNYKQTYSNGMYLKVELTLNYKGGFIYSNKGNKIEAELPLSGTRTRTLYASDGTVVSKVTEKVIERKHIDLVSDCHGLTFCDNEMWVSDYAEDGSETVDVLLRDGYTETPNKKNSDIVVFYKNGKVVHSSVTTATGYDSNAGTGVKKSYPTLLGASSNLTNITIPENVKHYKNDGNKILNLSGGKPAGTTSGVKIYDEEEVEAAFKKP